MSGYISRQLNYLTGCAKLSGLAYYCCMRPYCIQYLSHPFKYFPWTLFLPTFFLDQPLYCVLLIIEGINLDTLCQIIANFYRKNVPKGKSYKVKHICQDGISKAQVQHVIEYAEATESVSYRKGVRAPKNLTKPQEDVIKEKSRKRKLPPLQLQGSMIYSSELM